MREALAILQEEGLQPMWRRHQEVHDQLWAGLRGLGLEPFVQADADRCAGA
jgi:alanine-glyoxylate transaminase/serine-glyoxylate transaminase/serine-pyruvate transaminase